MTITITRHGPNATLSTPHRSVTVPAASVGPILASLRATLGGRVTIIKGERH